MICRVALLIALTALTVSPAAADDGPWNRFRGPNGTGISHATTVPVEWTEKDYNWKIELPGVGHSSPVVWEKRIFVTCGDPHGLRTVLCLDVADGRTLWKREYPSKRYSQHPFNNYASHTPTVDAAGVVVTWTTPDALVLLALDLEGRELWQRDLGPVVEAWGSAFRRSCTRTWSCWPTTRKTWPVARAGKRTDPIRRAGAS